MLETCLLCHGGEEGDQDTEKPEGHPVTITEKSNKGQVISCDDFDLRASAVPRRRGEPQESLQAGPYSCVILRGRVSTTLGKAEYGERGNFQSSGCLKQVGFFF